MDIIPYIDMSGIFPEMPMPDMPLDLPEENQIPLRWWNMNTAKNYLAVSERTVRRYMAAGKVDTRYKTVKGHRRVYLSNRSVIKIKEQKQLKEMMSGINGWDFLLTLVSMITYGERHGLL